MEQVVVTAPVTCQALIPSEGDVIGTTLDDGKVGD
jgi:hypothetical protein